MVWVDKMMRKRLLIILVMLLGFYPITELTLAIWTKGIRSHPELLITSLIETTTMWILYLAIIPILGRTLR